MRFVLNLLILVLLTHCGSLPNTSSSSDSTSSTGTSGTSGTSSSSSTSLMLPYPSGTSYSVSQGFSGSFSHNEDCTQYAIDFTMDSNSTIVAAASGRVIALKEDSNTGCSTNACIDDANYILIDHGNGGYAYYLHLCLNCADVRLGQVVAQGQTIGRSGNTGWSTQPHLHFSYNSWETGCTQSFSFSDVDNSDGIPTSGETYESSNTESSSTSDYSASTIPVGTFSTNGVTLDSGLPLTYTKGDTLTITGTITDGKSNVAIFLIEDGSWVDGSTASAGSDNTFSISWTIDTSLTVGTYTIAMVTSNTNSYSSQYSRYVYVSD